MRTAFIKQLVEEAKKNDKIYLLVGDLGFSVVEEFAELFPDRYKNVGIAEQNMAGMAAGLAMLGYNVYIYSIGNFPTLRCMEQIRYDIAYPNLNVKIVAVGGGYSYGNLGASHHATEEIGMLRTIPNMVVCAPGDPAEAKAITSYSSTFDGPMYIRLGRAGEPEVHTDVYQLSVGAPSPIISNGNKKAIFTTGSMLKYAFDFVKENKLSSDLFSIPVIKPLNEKAIMETVVKYDFIATIEDHQKSCGMGSAIVECINDLIACGKLNKADTPTIKRIAIPDMFQSVSGTCDYIRKATGLVLDIKDFK